MRIPTLCFRCRVRGVVSSFSLHDAACGSNSSGSFAQEADSVQRKCRAEFLRLLLHAKMAPLHLGATVETRLHTLHTPASDSSLCLLLIPQKLAHPKVQYMSNRKAGTPANNLVQQERHFLLVWTHKRRKSKPEYLTIHSKWTQASTPRGQARVKARQHHRPADPCAPCSRV